MRTILFFFIASCLFSCKSEKVVEIVSDFERELIGFGMAGPHPDSLVGYWELNPNAFDEWHFQNVSDLQLPTTFLRDTMLVCNANLVYSVREKYEGYLFDNANSKYLVSYESDLFRFDKIEGRNEMPNRFYVKKYPNTLPDGFQYYDLRAFDGIYRMEFLINFKNRTELIVQQRDNGTSSNVNRFCLRRKWTPDEQMYINTFLHALCERRLDTSYHNICINAASASATLVYNDSVYHYDFPPIFQEQFNYLRLFLISRLQWYHYTDERLPMPYLKKEYFHRLPVVIEMDGPSFFD